MSDARTVEVIGADRFARTMHDAAREIAQMDDAADAAGRLVAAQGSANAPRVTGLLARSVRAESDGAGGTVIGSALIYAPVIHNGWAGHNIAANPFLSRALDQRAEQVADAYGRELGKAISHVKGA